MKTLFVPILSFCCVACISASPAKVDEHFAVWRASYIDQLIQRWGVPQQQKEINEKLYAEWTRTKVSSKPAFSIGVGGFGGNVGGSVGTTVGGKDQLNACTVQVEYDASGLITDLRWNGDTDICVDKFEVPPAPAS